MNRIKNYVRKVSVISSTFFGVLVNRGITRAVMKLGLYFLLVTVVVHSQVFSSSNPSPTPGSVKLSVKIHSTNESLKKSETQALNFRYAPLRWQSCIGLPDDPHKSVAGSKGGLYYDFGGGPYYDFRTRVKADLKGENEYTPVHQYLLGARIPIVITEKRVNGVTLHQEAWARVPDKKGVENWAPQRADYLWLKMENRSSEVQTGQVVLHIGSDEDLELNARKNQLVEVESPENVFCTFSTQPSTVQGPADSLTILFPEKRLAPGGELQALVTLYPAVFDQPNNRDTTFNKEYQHYKAEVSPTRLQTIPTSLSRIQKERTRAIDYWQNTDLPYNNISVPDPGIQRLLDASIRNIYQARELKNSQPVFQVGPTYYRGSWAADGPFIMEAITYLGRWQEVRAGLEQQVDRDTGPGGVAFSKKSGLRLWMMWRHAQLTGDWDWLETMWPKVVREVDTIKKYRRMTMTDPSQANYGLMPIGTGDGGLGGMHREYTNVYWTLAGLKIALKMARQLDKPVLADWENEYEDYWQAFDKARHRDALIDARGNIYVPPTMIGETKELPQRGAWAFLQSIYPGRLFSAKDTLMRGTMAMLDATQQEGQIYGTGWLAHGIWNYAGSFYAHAHLWLGDGEKAASTMYAFGNHASPVYTWREEQYPVGEQRGEGFVGDMPHNWASGEFIRLIRNLLILERGRELHLLEGMPHTWTMPGKQTKLVNIPTSFGATSVSVDMAEDGQSARITIDPPRRDPPDKIAVHLEKFKRPIWSVESDGKFLEPDQVLQIQSSKEIILKIQFKHAVEQRYSKPKPGFDTLSFP